MLKARYKPNVKSIEDTYFKPKTSFDESSQLVKISDTVKYFYDEKGVLNKWVNLDTVNSCLFIYSSRGLVVGISNHQKEVLRFVNSINYDSQSRIIQETIQEPLISSDPKSQYIFMIMIRQIKS